eukprot:TRINITY_DN1142_c1_g2_i1.p1 TRINITY_DN1142_c1_g2~~TRINITY_DN1142_c1_g2_i1.p1  ORF type:complete len:541 (+),score=152.20 TRINITY_DN1142_c1_g2_i1:171-1793(+)
MADAEGSSRKRSSEKQITKDDYEREVEEVEDASDIVHGSFQRASEEVMARRRIVKARRTVAGSSSGGDVQSGGVGIALSSTSKAVGEIGGGGAGPAKTPAGPSNPFAGISLVPPTADASLPSALEAQSSGQVESAKPAEAGVVEEEEEEEADEVDSGPATARGVNSQEEEKRKVNETSKSEKEAPRRSAFVNNHGAKADIPPADAEEGGGENDNEEVGEVDGNAQLLLKQEDGKEKSVDSKVSAGKQTPRMSGFGFAPLSTKPNAFSFGFSSSANASTSASPGFSFSFVPNSSSSGAAQSIFPPLGSSGFSFGTAGAGQTGQLFSSSATSSPAPSGGSRPLSSFAASPAVKLSEVAVETGEEKEQTVFTADAVLFEFAEGGKWRERGKGQLRLNLPEHESRPARLVMRAKGNLRLLLNANLFPDIKIAKMDGRGVSFSCVNSASEGEGKEMATLAVRMKDENLLAEFVKAVDEHKAWGNAPGTEIAPENGESQAPETATERKEPYQKGHSKDLDAEEKKHSIEPASEAVSSPVVTKEATV